MRIVPSSTVTLYSGVEIDNGEQLAFASVNGQNAYFASKLVLQAVPCTMVRKTGALRLEVAGSVVKTCNYLSFVNPDFDNKTIYARIIDYDYINNECVEISYAIDYWQTWMFDVEFDDMFIEREHLSEEDWDKAELNPYDPTIFELKTNEDLPVSKDLEKLNYTIGSDTSDDGYKLSKAIIDATSISYNHLGVLIKISYIDFSDLDTQITTGTRPSQQFANWLNALSTGLGFWVISQDMIDYLYGLYPTILPNSRYTKGADWTYGGTNVYPFYGSMYRPPCCYIYDPYGGELTGGHMSEFFAMMTRFSGGDPSKYIIDLSLVPNHLMFLAGRRDDGTSLSTLPIGQITAKDLNVDSHKLMRYPYSYMRAMTSCGDVKEYKYERFENVQEGEDVCQISVLLDITDRPTLMVAPKEYEMTGLSDDSEDCNILEGLFFDQFPTLPYTIDAFTAQVAAVANSTIANRTPVNAADMAATDVGTNKASQLIATLENVVGIGASAAGAGTALGGKPPKEKSTSMLRDASLLGGFAEGGVRAAGMYNVGANMALERQKYETQAEAWFGAENALTEVGGGTIANQLNLAKPAYACDVYYPSNGIGATNFAYVSFCDLITLRVTLNSDILALYDNWFKHYGYTSGRCGIPRICNYVAGSSTPADVPHWETINGRDATYIKTMDCKIKYSMIPVASTIKAMFDGGIRMIKGD